MQIFFALILDRQIPRGSNYFIRNNVLTGCVNVKLVHVHHQRVTLVLEKGIIDGLLYLTSGPSGPLFPFSPLEPNELPGSP